MFKKLHIAAIVVLTVGVISLNFVPLAYDMSPKYAEAGGTQPGGAGSTQPGGGGGTQPGGGGGTQPGGGGTGGGIVLTNPLKADTLQCLIFDAFRVIINLLAILAALYLIFSGFRFVAAQGSENKLKEAKRAFMNAVIGTAIILGAWAITTFIVNTVNEILNKPVAGVPTETTCEDSSDEEGDVITI